MFVNCQKCRFAMNPNVRLSVGWSVMIFHKGWEVTLSHSPIGVLVLPIFIYNNYIHIVIYNNVR